MLTALFSAMSLCIQDCSAAKKGKKTESSAKCENGKCKKKMWGGPRTCNVADCDGNVMMTCQKCKVAGHENIKPVCQTCGAVADKKKGADSGARGKKANESISAAEEDDD